MHVITLAQRFVWSRSDLLRLTWPATSSGEQSGYSWLRLYRSARTTPVVRFGAAFRALLVLYW